MGKNWFLVLVSRNNSRVFRGEMMGRYPTKISHDVASGKHPLVAHNISWMSPRNKQSSCAINSDSEAKSKPSNAKTMQKFRGKGLKKLQAVMIHQAQKWDLLQGISKFSASTHE